MKVTREEKMSFGTAICTGCKIAEECSGSGMTFWWPLRAGGAPPAVGGRGGETGGDKK